MLTKQKIVIITTSLLLYVKYVYKKNGALMERPPTECPSDILTRTERPLDD
jgi:hypothetical protein